MKLHGNKKPKVSIVVVNAKGTRQLRKCLNYLARTNYPDYEITVVDCLTDSLARWVNEFFPSIKVIHYDYDIGPSHSHNVERKVGDAESKYLAFIDNDAYVTEDWLTELVEVMESSEKIGVAQAKILTTKGDGLLDHTGIAIDALGTWHTTRGLKGSKFRNVFEIFAASSAGCIVRRKVFDEVGGFDPDYFIYDDDTDFSFRVRLLGYEIVFVPSSIIFHEGGLTRALAPKKLYHSVKNRMYTMLKNFELKNLWWRFSLYLTLTFLAGIGFASMRKVDEAIEIFRSITHTFTNLKRVWTKRMFVQLNRHIKDSELFHSGFLRNDIRPTWRDIRLKMQHLNA